MTTYLPLLLFFCTCVALMLGFPVAFTLGGVAVIFGVAGVLTGTIPETYLHLLPERLFGIMNNETLLAVPLFVLMGVLLEKSKIAENLLHTMARLMSAIPGGLGIAVALVGMLLAASTGIVGATVVTMGLLALPTMLRHGYDEKLAAGSIAATGTLGQIIPPSIALVLLGDVLSNAYQEAQLRLGVYATETVSVGDLFVGALIPGLMLVVLYIIYIFGRALMNPKLAPATTLDNQTDDAPLWRAIIVSLVPPLLLIVSVLGSILAGIATPTKAAAVGALGALGLSLLQRQLNLKALAEVTRSTSQITCMVFAILIGASIFSLVFRAYGGEDMIHSLFASLPGGKVSAILIVMLIIFLLGFILDFIEITFVVVPIVGPVLLAMGVDPIWLGVMIAMNLQTSFLTPPFGFALFYLRGVAPKSMATSTIYKGVIPFIVIQIIAMGAVAAWPELATALPQYIYGK